MTIAAVALFVLVALFTAPANNGLVVSAATFVMFSALGVFFISRENIDPKSKLNLISAFLAAFVMRFAASLILLDDFLSIYRIDQLNYLRFGKYLVDGSIANPFEALNRLGISGHAGFFIFVAAHLKITLDPIFISVTNAFLSAICVLFLYNIGRNIFANGNNRLILLISVWLYAFFPLSILWSVPILKEAISLFLCMFFIDQLFRYINGRIIFPAILMGASVVALATIRAYLAPILIITGALSIMFYPGKKMKVVLTSILLLCVISIGFAIFWNKLSESRSVGYAFLAVSSLTDKESMSKVSSYREEFSNKGSSDVDKIQYNSPVDLITHFPMGFVRSLTTPVRWFRDDMNSLDKIITIGTSIWYLIMPFSFAGVYELLRRRFRISVAALSFMAMLMLYFSLILMGGAGRQMCILYPLFCILAATGISNWKALLPGVFAGYIILGALVTSAEFSPIVTIAILAPAMLFIFITVYIFIQTNEKKLRENMADAKNA